MISSEKYKFTLFFKFFLLIFVLVLVLVIVIIFAVVNKEQVMIVDQMKSKGLILSEILSMESINAFVSYDYSTLKQYVNKIMRDEAVISIIICDTNFQVKMHGNIKCLGSIVDDDFNKKALKNDNSIFQIIPKT